MDSLLSIEALYDQVTEILPPTARLSLSEWADLHAVLSPESAAEPGKWTTLPYQRAMMDAFTEPPVETIVVKKSSRVGYTKILDNIIGFSMVQDPCSVLVVQPTKPDAEGYSKDEIAPMLRDTPILQGVSTDETGRNNSNTVAKKVYRGGILNLIGAHSPSGFRRLTVRVVLFDEIDGYPPMAGKEGDQLGLGRRRAQDFYNRKYVLGSSPTVKGASKIEAEFKLSSRGYYMVPCPDCNTFHVRKFSDRGTIKVRGEVLPQATLSWPEGQPEEAAWLCPECGVLIGYEHHRWQLANGYWYGEHWEWRDKIGFRFLSGFKGSIGFEIWAGYSYSPNCTPAKLAEEFLKAREQTETLRTFVNTVMGEPWEDLSLGLDPDEMAESAEYDVEECPEDVALLTAGVDTQGDRLSVQKVGWSYHGVLVPKVISWVELPGDPNDPETWDQLLEHLDDPIPHPSGAMLTPKMVAIDSGGHHTQTVYDFAFEHRNRGIIAIKGRTGTGPILKGNPTRVDHRRDGKPIKRGASFYNMHVDVAKSWIFGRLKADTDQRLLHFPRGLDDRYFLQLTAEHWDAKLKRWIRHTKRNEALDTLVYAIGCAFHPWLRLDQKTGAWFEQQLKAMREKQPVLQGGKINLGGRGRFGARDER